LKRAIVEFDQLLGHCPSCPCLFFLPQANTSLITSVMTHAKALALTASTASGNPSGAI
jgi:hypothetical protein